MAQATKSRKRVAASKTRKVRATLTVSDIRNRFKEMDANIRQAVKGGLKTPTTLGKHVSRNWTKLFMKPLSSKAAQSLAQHYLNLHGKKGGSLSGSPLDYTMRPGLPAVAVYATFPTEVGSDPNAVKDLDVYYNNALGRSCGVENTAIKPWAGIGTNVVPLPATGPLAPTHHTPEARLAPAPVALPPAKGGRRKMGTYRKSSCLGGGAFSTTYSPNQRIIKGGKRSTKRSTKRNNRKSGGDFLTALSSRSFISANPAGFMQRSSEIYTGQPQYARDNGDPSVTQWNPMPVRMVDKPLLHEALHGDMALAAHPKVPGVSAIP